MPTEEPLRTRCGMRCDICPAYKPNRASADLQRASVVWAELFDVHLAPEQIVCGGCRGNADELLDKQCSVRPCVISRGFADCSECPEMPCAHLKRRWVSRPELETKLGRPIADDDFRRYVLPFENVPYLVAHGGRAEHERGASERKIDDRITVRDEGAADRAGIRQVNRLAFGQPDEAAMVDAVRAAGVTTLSLVATRSESVVGHILFSPVSITTPARTISAVGLAPVAVAPKLQKQGIGSLLVRAGLDRLRKNGHRAVVVLGHPTYYPRFGFVPASRFGIRWELACPDEAFMALELVDQSLAGLGGGVVRFRPEFTAGAPAQ